VQHDWQIANGQWTNKEAGQSSTWQELDQCSSHLDPNCKMKGCVGSPKTRMWLNSFKWE